MIQIILGGVTLGLLSSFHCVGMCGPIALSLPNKHLSGNRQTVSILTYNIGRIITYVFLGLVIGLVGKNMYIAGLQRWLSITIGCFMLLVLIHNYFKKTSFQPAFIKKFNRFVQQQIIFLLRSPGKYQFILLGMANGLLPCGMVYLAIAAALVTNNIIDGSLFMAMYGLGTLPAMLAISFLGVFASHNARNTIKKLMPGIITITAILFILRGMNLGIPYISPVIAHASVEVISCH